MAGFWPRAMETLRGLAMLPSVIMGDLEPGARWGDLLGWGEREEWGDRWGEKPSMLGRLGDHWYGKV